MTRARTRRRWTPTRRGWALAVGGVTVAAVVAAVGLRPEKPLQLESGWSDTVAVEDADGATVTDLASTDAGFVAVGFAGSVTAPEPAAWTSVDGTRFERVDPVEFLPGQDPAAARLTAVAASGPTVVVGGVDTSEPDPVVAFWVSQDGGHTWERITHDDEVFRSGEVHAIQSNGGGWVAVGGHERDGRTVPDVWRSPDGFLWEHLAPDTRDDTSHEVMTALGSGGPGLLAGGTSEDREGDVATVHTPLWGSTDGRTWQQQADGVARFEAETTVTSFGSLDQATVAFATVGSQDEPRRAQGFLSRDQGASWEAHDLPTDAGIPAAVQDVTTGVEKTLVAVGWAERDGEPRPAIWLSQDAAEWKLVHADVLAGNGRARRTASSGSVTVVLGDDGAGSVRGWRHGPPPSG